jgi:hypothetical protein
MRVALKIVKWVLILLLLCIAALAAVNATDEAAAPEYQAFFTFSRTAAAGSDKNGAYHLIGFYAPEGQDPHAAGVDAVKMVEQLTRDKPNETITQTAILGGKTLVFKGDGSVLCDFQQANCLAKARENRAALEQLAADNSVLLERYARLGNYEGAANPFPPRYTNPPVVFPERTHRLRLSLIAVIAATGSLDKAIQDLAEDAAMLRRLLRGPQAVAERNLKLVELARDVRLAGELTRDGELAPAAAEAFARILTPLGKDEQDYGSSALYEGASYLSLFDVYRDWGARSDAWYGMATKFAWGSVYKDQATVNRAARVMQAATNVLKSPADELGERQQALAEVIRVESDINWKTVYNPVGKFFVNLNLRGFEPRSPAPLHDLVGLMRLVALQDRIKREKVIDERIRGFVENSGLEFANPYTKRPMSWNATDRTLGFEGGAGKGLITVRIPTTVVVDESKADKAKKPQPIPANILKQIQGGGVQQP